MGEGFSKLKQKRVFHIITTSRWGGAQKVCYDLAVGLTKKGFLVDVACAPGGLLVEKLKEKQIHVFSIPSLKEKPSPFYDLKTIWVLYKLIRKNKYQIVHCHSTKAGILGRISAKLAGTPKIFFTVHGWSFYRWQKKKGIKYKFLTKFFVFLERIVAKITDKIICVSENDKKEGLKNKITSPEKITIIRNGIEFKIKTQIGKPTDRIIIGNIARLTYQKRPDLFLRIAKEIIKEKKGVKFVWVGGGEWLDKFQKFVREHHLEKNIIATGDKRPEEIQQYLVDFDIFILTSEWEGLPISIIEAMFAQKPIVAFDVGGLREMIQNKINGFLVPFGDLKKYKEKLKLLIQDKKRRREMGRQSFYFAQSQFGLQRMIKEYEKLYLNCLN